MNKIKVLLAEDEINLGEIIKDTLTSRNFIVYHAENGEIAKQIYKEQQPDVLVLDVMMPLKDGFTLAKEIRLENKNIPILFLTAKSQTTDVLEGFKHGGNDYLKKPFSIEELIVRINALLNRIQLNNAVDTIKIGNFNFNYTNQTLQYNTEIYKLTHREASLLF